MYFADGTELAGPRDPLEIAEIENQNRIAAGSDMRQVERRKEIQPGPLYLRQWDMPCICERKGERRAFLSKFEFDFLLSTHH